MIFLASSSAKIEIVSVFFFTDFHLVKINNFKLLTVWSIDPNLTKVIASRAFT